MNEEDQELFLQMLLKLDGSRGSIKAASKWCHAYSQHHIEITRMWFFAVASAQTMKRRLDLFHLVSDILFTVKPTSVQYYSSFLPQLVKAIPFTRGDEIKMSMTKLFLIWKKKNIYNKVVMTKLYDLLRNTNKVVDMNMFRYDRPLMFNNLRRVQDLEPACNYLMEGLENSLSFENSESLLCSIKERRECISLLHAVDAKKTKLTYLVSFMDEMVHLLKMTTWALDIAANKENNGVEETLLKIRAYGAFQEKVVSVFRRLESSYNSTTTDVVADTPASPEPKEEITRRVSGMHLDDPPPQFSSMATSSYWNSPKRSGHDKGIFHREERGSMTPLRDEKSWTPGSPTYTGPANLSFAGSASTSYAGASSAPFGGSASPSYSGTSWPPFASPKYFGHASPTYAGSASTVYAGSASIICAGSASTVHAGSASPLYSRSMSPSYSGSSSWGAAGQSFSSGSVYRTEYTDINQTANCSSPRCNPLLPNPTLPVVPNPSSSSLPSLMPIPFPTYEVPSHRAQK